MKTISQSVHNQNISEHERGFRTVSGLGILTMIVAGAVASPAALFALSLVGVYLVMTAIVGIDPFYALAQSIGQRPVRHNIKSGQAYA